MRVAVIGRSEILYNTILHLVKKGFKISCIITSKEAPEYTKNANDYEDLAKKLNVPFRRTSKLVNNISFLKKSQSDISVSVNYTGIIPQRIIDLFPLGILNAHGGDLPKYRGNACQAWAIINGETRIGLCIHQMIGGELDSGDILAREYHMINSKTKIADIFHWMTERVPEMFSKTLSELERNPDFILERQSKDPSKALRCYPRKPEDGRINWSNSKETIQRLINASGPPYEGAFCYLGQQKIYIFDCDILETYENYCAVSGQILKIEDKNIIVATCNGELKLSNIFVNGLKIEIKDVFNSIRQRLN